MKQIQSIEEFIREYGDLSEEEIRSLSLEGVSDLFDRIGDKIQDEGETIRIDKETFTALLLLSEKSQIDLLSRFAEILKRYIHTAPPEKVRRTLS